jgi:16S rRNA (uracil1498-N3)-methyltransferase
VSAALFYVDALPGVGGLAVIDGDEGFHASNVRRLRAGEHIDLADGSGTVAHCVVEATAKGSVSARVEDVTTVGVPTPTVTVVQALPKSERSELAIELATEAGADGFLAWQASRCVARWDGAARVDKGLRRWSSVARAAARQSRRPLVPDVAALVSTSDLVRRIREDTAAGGLALALHEAASEPLIDIDFGGVPSLLLIVGPEGGISDDEIDALREAGARAVRLGPTVLRTSTAAAVALGALGALTPRWR